MLYQMILTMVISNTTITEFPPDIKVVRLKAIRGPTISIQFDIERELKRAENLKANGYTIKIHTDNIIKNFC